MCWRSSDILYGELLMKKSLKSHNTKGGESFIHLLITTTHDPTPYTLKACSWQYWRVDPIDSYYTYWIEYHHITPFTKLSIYYEMALLRRGIMDLREGNRCGRWGRCHNVVDYVLTIAFQISNKWSLYVYKRFTGCFTWSVWIRKRSSKI